MLAFTPGQRITSEQPTPFEPLGVKKSAFLTELSAVLLVLWDRQTVRLIML